MYLIDSYYHLNFDGLADRLPKVFASMRVRRAGQALAISVSRESFVEVFAITENNGHTFYTIGVHPDRQDVAEFSVTETVAQAQHPRAVGIGETGLDYYWCRGDLAWQHRCFADHIQAANGAGLPVMVHTRDVAANTLRPLKECNTRTGVTHCFFKDVVFAKAALGLGLYISFSGIVTFKSTPLIQEAVRCAPTNGVLMETDSPSLAPVPKRGKPNEPSYVRCTTELLVKLRGGTPERVTETATGDFYRLFSKVPRIA